MSIRLLQQGQIVKIRSCQYFAEDCVPSDYDTRVRLACLEEDAVGVQLEVFWKRGIDRQRNDQHC
jgi:hypothetical protein